MPARTPGQSGFSLVELITVMTVAGILAAVLVRNVTDPIQGLVDLERRAELVDVAETSLSRMTREIRLALPNSVRVTGASTIEFLRTLDGGRYRLQGDGSDTDFCPGDADPLDFTATADCFEVLDQIDNFAAIDADAGDETDCISADSDCLVVFNTGQGGANAYDFDNIAGITAKAIAPDPVNPGANVVALNFDRSNAATPFPFQSPEQRFHIVDTPVRFVCNTGLAEIRRFAEYAIDPDPTLAPSGGVNQLLADRIAACTFAYDPGSATRAALVTLSVTVADSGESVTLLQQVHVRNIP